MSKRHHESNKSDDGPATKKKRTEDAAAATAAEDVHHEALRNQVYLRLAAIAGKCNILVSDGTSESGMVGAWAELEVELSDTIIGYGCLRPHVQSGGAMLLVWPRNVTTYAPCLQALARELNWTDDDFFWRMDAVRIGSRPHDAPSVTVAAYMRDPDAEDSSDSASE